MDTNIERFLNNEMNKEERALFIKEMNSNEKLKEAVEIYKEMQLIYNDDDWNIENLSTKHPKIDRSLTFLRSEKGENIKNVIAEEANLYFSEKPTSSRIRKLFLMVGSIAAIFIISFFLLKAKETNTDLYAEYKNDWKELPSLTLRGDNNNFTSVEALFKQKKYKESLLLLEQLKQTTSQDSQILMYEGILNLELNKKEKAIRIFKDLLKRDSLDTFKAHWYLALSYLKSNNLNSTKMELQILLNDDKNFKDIEAKELLHKLEKLN